MRELERVILLRVVDEYWMDHIDAMDDLKQGIRLRAYANTDPIVAYKQESLSMFEEMIAAIQAETVRRLFSVRLPQGRGGQAGAGGQGHRGKRRRRRHRSQEAAPEGHQDRPERSLPLRQRQEVQELLRPQRLSGSCTRKRAS